ncbi:MAG TPA: hypothetical protein EYN66_14240, partial [Myxococcales bacterium]|nr:hypothetical protein [Myxococcales bacterium]
MTLRTFYIAAFFLWGCADAGSNLLVTPSVLDADQDGELHDLDAETAEEGDLSSSPDGLGEPDAVEGADNIDDLSEPDVDSEAGLDAEVEIVEELDLDCTPCALGAMCQGELACVSYGEPGAFCGADCKKFRCTVDSEGQSTDCSQKNNIGTCSGLRECINGKLSKCDAPAAGPDICDGKDNDCDGVADEGWPDLDGDGLVNCIDDDLDGDGVKNINDNCVKEPNPKQENQDGDAFGDLCDDDVDGDGIPNDKDCEPNKPEAEGGEEICNGIDDDCDGSIDEANAIGCKVYFMDLDNDGWGATGKQSCVCKPVYPYTAVMGGDCDDTSKSVNPNMPEICDVKDNDCDGKKDEAGALGCKKWFYDGDGDGFHADGAVSNCLCAANAQTKYTSLLSGDCDDFDFSTHPGSIEKCNGQDSNCNGINDEGCDDDEDGYCDTDFEWSPGAVVTCANGPGDCDDLAAAIHPGAKELCDGVDNNCNPADSDLEGTVLACGPQCEPCPTATDDTAYLCTGAGPSGGCVQTCPKDTFCADCSCDGLNVISVGSAITTAQVLYDSHLDSFRVAYYQDGGFRMRRLTSSGHFVSDQLVVPSVSQWTTWGVVQHPESGQFVFAWTYYPDSAIRVAIVSANASLVTSQVVIPALPPGLNVRQNVQIGWNSVSKSFLLVWDEKSGNDVNIRGALLNETFVILGTDFEIVGGPGTQGAPTLAAR